MLKKITLFVLIFFAAVAGYIYVVALLPFKTTTGGVVFNNLVLPAKTTESSSSGVSIGSGFLLNDVAKHSSLTDCYLVINNNVYNVSSYIKFHPGGQRQITSRCGQEVTGIFSAIHSNRAWDLLADYKIGQLQTAPQNNLVKASLDDIEAGFKKANPDVEVVSVKPKNDFFVAKVIYQNNLYEVHLDKSGQIIKEEVESDEFDWSAWDSDQDDN